MPPMSLHTMTSPWPFSTWGIDIIGKIHPTWIEVSSFKVLNSKKVAQFILTNIIYRYGVPYEIISDNG